MNKFTKIAAAIIAASSLVLMPLSAQARETGSQNGANMVVLNPGGGATAGGSDGIKMMFNSYEDPLVGSDQVYFAGANQWCCWSGAGPVLLVGDYEVGETNAATYTGPSWDSVVISNLTGAYQSVASGSGTITSTTTGNATATLTYTATVSARTYTVVRAISYTYPHNYYDETWTVTVPSGNTAAVKLYVGGDAAPGGDDNGNGSSQVVGGLRAIYEANPDSGQYISYEELDASKAFTHYFVGGYQDPYVTIQDGLDLPDSTLTTDHDAGLQVQWSFGSTAGSYAKTMRTTIGYNSNIPGFVDPERVDLNLDLALDAAAGEIVAGSDVLLQGGGLIAMSPLTLVMRSTPINIDLYGETADGHGNFSFPATLPSPIEPGVHSLTLTGIRPDGTPISDVLYFKIGADGKLLWTNVGSALAETGVDAGIYGIAALGLLAAGGAAVAVRRRRNAA